MSDSKWSLIDVAITVAKSQLEISELERRAARRLGNLERRRQGNIDAITVKAMEVLPPAVSPNPAEQDWVYRFFGECQDVSDEQMQQLWASILAGEVATPGSFGLRPWRSFAISLEKMLKRSPSSRRWHGSSNAKPSLSRHGCLAPCIRGAFERVGLTFNDVLQLETLGLLRTYIGATSRHRPQQATFEAFYFDERYLIELPDGVEAINTGPVVAQ